MRIATSITLLLMCLQSWSQEEVSNLCQHNKRHLPLRGGSIYQDPGNLRSDTLDILHYDITLDFTLMDDDLISGACRVDFRSLMDEVQLLHLDLLALTVDSVVANNALLDFQHAGESLLISLPQAMQTNEDAAVTVYYHGTPVEDPTWGGFYFSSGYAYNLGVGFTSVPHNFGRVWFPCFDNFVERSSYSYHVLTNEGRTAYCNGLRTGVESAGDDSLLTHWQLQEEIPTYLACVAVAPYTHVTQTYQSITGEDIPVWLTAKPADTTDMKLSMINLHNCLLGYENNYGPYRWQKVGYSAVPFSSGALEHATNIAYPLITLDGTTSYETLYAHELSHHWWGDLVTCRNAADMWLNEGWARYSEAIFLEHQYGEISYNNNIKNLHKDVLLYAHRNDGGRYPVSGIPTEVTYGDHVYNKGGDIAHTLRSYMGDEDFFEAIRDLMEQRQFTDHSSEDLRDFFQQYTQRDLTAFFDQWVFEPGFPEFRVEHFSTQGGNTYEVIVQQFMHYNSDYYTDVPMMLTARDANGATHSQLVILDGQETVLTVQLPEGFVADNFYLNEDRGISMAVLADQKIAYNDGLNDLDYAEMDINIEVMGGVDSIFLRVENHWAAADDQLVQGDYYLSPDRWWSLYHTGDSSTEITGTIRYYGNENDTKYFDPLFFEYLEANGYNEDSLVLMYRPNGISAWAVWPNYELLISPSIDNWTGRIRINQMHSGQYAWAVPTGPTTVVERKDNDISIFYNRSNISLRAKGKRGTAEVFDANGRMIKSVSLVNTVDLSTQGWSEGVYIVRWTDQATNEQRSVRIVIEQ